MERKSKSKKILAGMMTGFSVLSTQSVLGSFQKLPMGGGHELISYAETGNSPSTVNVKLTASSDARNPIDYKGTLKYKINFEGNKSNFTINTILRNSGVTKAVAGADGTTDVLAQDVTTSPLKIKDTAKFFKAKANGGSNLIEFNLLAKYKDSSGASQSEDLALNTGNEYITEDGEGYQSGNTYQIINKDDV